MSAAGSVAPNIFDVRADPEILYALVLANGMSPRLWGLVERIARLAEDPADDVPAYVRGAQRVLDRYFTHLTPTQVLEIDGVLDIDAEARRLGSDVVEQALESIAATFRWRIAHGYSAADDPTITLVEERRFPAYTYGEIDTLHAYRKQLGRRSGRPQGLTSCLDEAALFAALVMVLPDPARRSVVVLAQPAHYTVFGWIGDRTWWFYGKNRLHSARQHGDMVDADYGGDPVLAFDDVMAQFDRIVTRRGTFDLATGESSIPRAELDEITERMRGYFRMVPSALEQALDRGVRHTEPSAFDELFERCVRRRSSDEVQAEVRAAALEDSPLGEAATAALACHRSLAVADPSVYLPAAREGSQLREARSRVSSVEDALAIVCAVEGRESMFGDPDRIAMPEEVLVLGTGSARDRALLLHVLLEPLVDGPVTTVITTDDAVVHCPLGAFGGPDLQPVDGAHVERPDGGLIVQLAA